MQRVLIATITAFLVAVIIAPIVIKLAKSLKARQVILSYVDNHKKKSGTPTMGGIIFVVAIASTCLIFFKEDKLFGLLTLAIMSAYAINGFLDDFIKVFFKRNMGLSALQKILFQFAIAFITAFFVYNNSYIGSSIYLPFVSTEINLGVLIIPFVVLIFVASTNSVNLTDGLDGLAGGVSMVFLLFFGAILFVITERIKAEGEAQLLINEYGNLLVFCGASVGALLGFLLFNSHTAKIFMGDTGSLALGGAIASVAVFAKQPFLLLIMGVMFVLSAVSVIIQVAYFKRTKKRIFLMAPLHHHFERKGVHETKIVAYYMIITTIIGIICLLLTIMFF